jgi:hypothetical protein
MSNDERIPRVFRNGEAIPAGVCVLYESGDVGYLDDTGDCDCEDVEHGQCEEHSYEVTNGNWGPLVEVILPDYIDAVEADRQVRSLAGT